MGTIRTEELRALGISHKLLAKIARIALHNPDMMSLTSTEALPAKVSPEIYAETRDMTLITKLRELNIYNILKYNTEDRAWQFAVIFHPKELVIISVPNEDEGKKLLFAEAVGIAILKAIEQRKK